jgi:NSS family neurotransmitter:Na+ symporter
MASKQEHWSSQLAFIIATIGSAVGVGNIWRFPYLVGLFGGGTFIVAYLISLLLFGIPVLYLELFAGKHFGLPAITVFQKINKKIANIFWLPFILNFVVLSFYIVVTGWTLYYFIFSLGDAELPFKEFTATSLPVFFDIAMAVILFLVIRKKLQEGIEKLNLILMPLFGICLLLLFLNSLHLKGFQTAVNFYLSFNMDAFLSAPLWMAAISQVIFSLGVGYLIMLTYGAYVKKNTNVARSTLTIALSDTVIAMVAALTVLAVVFTYGLDPSSGVSLSFNAFPAAFNSMEFGNLLMPAFFLLLFAAASTSAISMAEVVLSTLEAEFKIKREKAAIWTMVATLLCSLPSALSYSGFGLEFMGKPFFDFLNNDVVGFLSPLAILVTVGVLAYSEEMRRTIRNRYLLFILRYAMPLFLVLIFLKDLIK